MPPTRPLMQHMHRGMSRRSGFRRRLGISWGRPFCNGRARHGEVVKMVDHLRGVETTCEVCDPVFFDPDGGRMRG